MNWIRCSYLHHRILMLVCILSVLSIFYFDFNVLFLAAKHQYFAPVLYKRSTKKHFIIPLSSQLRRFARHNDHDHNKPPNRTEMLHQVEKNMRNLPRGPFLAENPSPSLIYNASCALYPSILDIQFTNSYWQRTNTSWGTFFMYGAYYDKRSHPNASNVPSVRILGVMEHYFDAKQPKDFCHLWFEDEDKPVITKIAEQDYIFYTKFNSKFASYLFTCTIPITHHGKVPKSVSIVIRPCDNALNLMGVQYEKSDLRKGFAVCVKGFDFPYQDISSRLIEWIEMNRILGAEKIFVYKYDPVHPNVSKVFDYYERTGFVDVTPYTMPGYLPNEAQLRHFYLQGYHRKQELMKTEIVPYNDCLYRNLYKYEYLTVVDTDEIIIPLKNLLTWKELVNVVKKAHPDDFLNFGAICFQNVYFFEYWMQEKPWFPNIPPYMYHMQHVYRGNSSYRPRLQSKCFHFVQDVVTLFNHTPIKCLNSCKFLYLNHTEAQLQHYKPKCPQYLNSCSEAIGRNPVIDRTIWKYLNPVVDRTVHVMKMLHLIEVKKADLDSTED